MITFLIDEDLPRSLKSELIKRGYNAIDVRDVGLRGQSDDKIYKYAQKKQNDFAGNLIIVEPGRIRLHKGTGD